MPTGSYLAYEFGLPQWLLPIGLVSSISQREEKVKRLFFRRHKLFKKAFGEITNNYGEFRKNKNIYKRRFVMKKDDMPVGFGMALAMNTEAMEKFATLPANKKQEIIAGTQSVSSKTEMKQYVENILSAF